MRQLLITTASLALTLGVAAPAFAQTPSATPAQPPVAEEPEPGRDVVVVSAQKRDEDIQDVPISISAFSEETLDEAGITDIRDLRNIAPSLNLATAPQLANTRIEIRGAIPRWRLRPAHGSAGFGPQRHPLGRGAARSSGHAVRPQRLDGRDAGQHQRAVEPV